MGCVRKARLATALLITGALAAGFAAASRAQRAAPLFTTEGGPIDVGHGVRVPDGSTLSTEPEACRPCHADIVDAWASSAHAASWTDPIFQSEYRITPMAFCRHCHAPRARGDQVRGVATAGIDCASCHVRDGVILGTRGRGGEAHAVRVERSLATERSCAPCHQFRFPDTRHGADRLPRYDPRQPLQDTVSEWARSAAGQAGRPCQRCHMPRRDAGEASHRFGGLSDPRMVREAVRVRLAARREGRRARVVARLSPRRVGHAFPTGDMFRQARLTVRGRRSSDTARLQRFFAQVMTDDERGFWLAPVDDTRVPPDRPLALELTLPRVGPAERTLRWSLDVWRLDPRVARQRRLPEHTVRVHVASGSVPLR